jgi:hypothetical protein
VPGDDDARAVAERFLTYLTAIGRSAEYGEGVYAHVRKDCFKFLAGLRALAAGNALGEHQRIFQMAAAVVAYPRVDGCVPPSATPQFSTATGKVSLVVASRTSPTGPQAVRVSRS